MLGSLMSYYSYKIDHDYGLAPNPFGGYCTLAVCKSGIRKNKNLKIGDWVIGTGSKQLNNLHELIFAMRVEEKLTFDQYWEDSRFQYKKPALNGSLVQMYGDNIYHTSPETGVWIQEDSAHSLSNGVNDGHLKRDVDGEFVLISRNFYYFGDKSVEIPKEYMAVCNEGRDYKSTSIPVAVADDFIQWLQDNFDSGIHGDPINWKEHLE